MGVDGAKVRRGVVLAIGAMAALFVAACAYALFDAMGTADRPLRSQRLPGPPDARELVVVVHGYLRGSDSMRGVCDAVREARPASDILLVDYACEPFSNADGCSIAAQLDDLIADEQRQRHYELIALCGYSLGSLLARKAYVFACGQVQDLPASGAERAASRETREWARHVDRIVLLAGTNRGWRVDDAPGEPPPPSNALGSVAFAVAKCTGTGRLVFQAERGSPFVANLRLQWLDAMKDARAGAHGLREPTVLQLLGDRDDVVSREDNRDVSVSKGFIWVGVHNTGHKDMIDLADPDTGPHRKSRIRQAFGGDAELAELRNQNVLPANDVDPGVDTVVFVLHGIRDMGGWTSQFEAPLQEAFATRRKGDGKKVHVCLAQYGYFAMGPFLLWGDRQRQVRWFMDQVTEMKAKYPNADHLHFIGHSNGTYVLASALSQYATLNVDRVAFAGSVVRRDYPWSTFVGRVGKVRNYVGSDDWVVGLFPCLFETPGFGWLNPDLGSAGFNGFTDPLGNSMETQFVGKGHGGALESCNVDSVVAFIVDGTRKDADELHRDGHPAVLEYASKACVLVWLGIVVVLVALPRIVVRTWICTWRRRWWPARPTRGRLRTFVAAYWLLVLLLLNRI